MPQRNELTPQNRNRLEDLFDLYDQNGDGQLTREEMKEFLQAIAYSLGLDMNNVNRRLNQALENRNFDNSPNSTMNREEAIDFILSDPF